MPDVTTSRQGRQRSIRGPISQTKKQAQKGGGDLLKSQARKPESGSNTCKPRTAVWPSKCHTAQAVRPNSLGGRQGYGGRGQSTEQSQRAGPWFLGCPRLTQPRALGPGTAILTLESGRPWFKSRHCTHLGRS